MAKQTAKKKSPSTGGAQHPDHSHEMPRLRRVIGQVEGIERMIQERRYCPDILQQLRAAQSALKALELEILKTHLASCIRNSAKTDQDQIFEQKLDQFLELIRS